MDQQTLDKIIPISGLDRAIGTVTGGINTGSYYKEIYGTQNYGVPVDTLIIETVRHNGSSSGSGSQTIPAKEQSNLQIQQSVSTQSTAQQEYAPQVLVNTQETIPVDAGGVFYSLINALFSVAVVLSVMGLMGVAYIIIRTRQLHHHEHDVRHAGEGHGHGSTQAHASAPVHHPPSTPHEPLSIDPHPIETAPVGANDEDEYEFIDAKSTEELAEDSEVVTQGSTTSGFGARWDAIQLRARGDDENDWRFALMDIGLLLEDVLTARGIPGNDLEEKLNAKEMEDFATHMIARDAYALHARILSNEVPLTADSIQELVSLYGKVFRELQV